MDQLKAIAVNSCKKSSELQKRAENFFNNLDSNGDKKVSFEELKNKDIISGHLFQVFTELDTNGDRTLDSEEIMTLFYYKHEVDKIVKSYKPSSRFCKGHLSRHWQEKPDFSCFLCLAKKYRRSYHICSDCHKKGVHLTHEHPEWCMLDRNALDLLDKMKYILYGEYKQEVNWIGVVTLSAAVVPPLTAIVAAAAQAGACTIM